MLLLDGIQDPGNLWAPSCARPTRWNVPVALLEGCADPFSHKVVRASMGAVFPPGPTVTSPGGSTGCLPSGWKQFPWR